MPLIDPSSAIIAKAKSKYGIRLTQKDYDAMIKCGSVAEVVQYLKTNTHYRRKLEKVSKDIHRGNLENIIHEYIFENFLTLCRYCPGDSPVASYILRTREIRELMRFVTLLSINRQHEYIFSLPLYFVRHTQIDLNALSKTVNSHSELVDALAHTPYQSIIERFPPDSEGDYDLSAVENALENADLGRLYDDIDKIKNKKYKGQLKELFDTLADYQNYSRIKRLKKYYHLDDSSLRANLLRYGNLSGKKLDRLLERYPIDRIEEALDQTSVGKKAQKTDADIDIGIRGRYELCRRQLYFSTNTEIVLLAYYILSEAELSNVIAVIEGVRYQMAPESIKETLVLSHRR